MGTGSGPAGAGSDEAGDIPNLSVDRDRSGREICRLEAQLLVKANCRVIEGEDIQLESLNAGRISQGCHYLRQEPQCQTATAPMWRNGDACQSGGVARPIQYCLGMGGEFTIGQKSTPHQALL